MHFYDHFQVPDQENVVTTYLRIGYIFQNLADPFGFQLLRGQDEVGRSQ